MLDSLEGAGYNARVRNDRVYSARRKTNSRVARESATPRVIEPAIRKIVTINGSIGRVSGLL